MTIDGMLLKEMFLSGAALIERNRQSIDALNVFPVPDGDTGTNMSQTALAAVKELNGRSFPTVGDVASAVARGALKGARGNSGVILSQIFRGFARALEGAEEMDAQLFVKALRYGSDTAYKAIMKPKEGTILTVARVIAEEVERAALATDDVAALMDTLIDSGDAILKRTPDLLPVLKQAGVVDSGGKGLMVFYAGFRAAMLGEPIDSLSSEEIAHPLPGEFVDDHGEIDDITFAYCTEYIVSHPKPTVKDSQVAQLRRRLERIGDSVVVVGDLEVVKVHLHTNDPGKAIQMGLELGELDDIKVDNMLEEFRERQEQRRLAAEAELKEFGIVAVALGDGLVEIFGDLGVDQVVDGGQTMNPSIDDLATAIAQTPAKAVFVLPNNTNIILAANQAAEIAEKPVYVIPTKSVPMGIAAAVAFKPDGDADENAQGMTRAAEQTHTVAITYAVRDTSFNGRQIRAGDIMGLCDNQITVLGDDINQVALESLAELADDETVLITIYYGGDLQPEKAQQLQQQVAEQYELCDVELHSGGQPLYYYLIAVE